jgi:hypothetical protein
MADRVAVHRIIVSKDDKQQTIEPGTRFETGEYGIDDETLKRFEARGVIREPRDENQRQNGPRVESETLNVVENRKPMSGGKPQEGQELGATQRVQEQPEGQQEQPEQSSTGRRSSRRMEDL